jgi:hypothetical protein
VPVEKRREIRQLEPGHKVFRQRRAVRAGVGDEDLQLFARLSTVLAIGSISDSGPLRAVCNNAGSI